MLLFHSLVEKFTLKTELSLIPLFLFQTGNIDQMVNIVTVEYLYLIFQASIFFINDYN